MKFAEISKLADLFVKLSTEYSLSEMKRDWNQYADSDPYFAIIRDPNKKGKWDEKEFYHLGENEANGILDKCKALKFPKKKNMALDFGCGIGRLTEPLSKHFTKVIGIDISDHMLDLAKEHTEKSKIKNIDYKDITHLSSIKSNSMDLIVTRFVLEHIPPNLAKKYIKEFTRILKPNGIATFEVPFSEPSENVSHNKKYIEKGEKEDIPITLVFSIPKHEVYKIIEDGDCYVIDSDETDGLVNKHFPAIFYWITK